MFTREQVRASVKAKLQNDARLLTVDEVEVNIDDALRHLNHDRPFVKVYDITGDGSQDYNLASFTKGFSDVQQVEYPAGETPPVYLQRLDDWIIYEDPTKPAGQQLRLRFLAENPTALEKIRVTLTTPWTVNLSDASLSTLDPDAFQALVCKALALCFKSLAARATGLTDPTIEADVVDRQGQVQNLLFLAERWDGYYKQLSGLGGEIKAGQAFGDIDIMASEGQDMLWHGARER